MPNNIWQDILAYEPEALYRGLLDIKNPKYFLKRFQAQRGSIGSQSFLDYWRSQYGNQYGNYMGQLGKMALTGQTPNLSFYDYLMQNPLEQQWQQLAPWTRGERQTPSLRWMIPR